MNTPTRKKLTCKGNSTDKLKTKGVDHTTLYYYQTAVENGDVDISAELESIATKLASAVGSETSSKGVLYSDLFEGKNGAGFMSNLATQFQHDLAEVAYGTASFGRAYKQTVVDAVDGLELSDFDSDGKGSAKVEVDNDFA